MVAAAQDAHPELVAKAQAVLANFDLPFTGPDGAKAAACATAGAAFVSMLAQMAATERIIDLNAPPCLTCKFDQPHRHVLPASTAAAVKALCDRAIDTLCAVVVACEG